MPKICISCSIPIKDIEATKFLHEKLGWALASASKMLAMGEKGFFHTCQLYLSDHLEHDTNIRAIIDFFHNKKVPLTILEISDSEDWSTANLNNLSKITDTQILNELNSSEDDD